MKTREDKERDQRSGKTEQPTNNKPASGERGNKEESGHRAQKTAGRNEPQAQGKPNRDR